MKTLSLLKKTISTELPAFVMGIVNATPDSFYEKSRGGIDAALKMIDEGADILDIGGESTRPFSSYVDEDEEISRVIPLIKKIRAYSDIPISVDTRKSAVMKIAFNEGADILNDVSALNDDEKTVELCARFGFPVILMHMNGNPGVMQKKENIACDDVFEKVNEYLEERARFAIQNGIKSEKIIVDPGIGFGKNIAADFSLVKNCGKLCEGKYPVLIGLSRKSCIGGVTDRSVEERLAGTICANALAVLNGASIIRVHDVKEARDSLLILNAIENNVCLQKEKSAIKPA